MTAAWYLRSRQLLVSIRYWVAITSYDIHDRSKSGRIYLLYLVVFFSIWVIAVLAWISSVITNFLRPLAATSPVEWAAAIPAACLLAWWVFSLLKAARRSPVRFDATDAVLVCNTPISRTHIIFSWLLIEWFISGVPFWAIGIVTGFSVTDLLLVQPDLTIWQQLPLYLSNGLRLFLPVVLIHTGLLALVWALGCYRLRGGQEKKTLGWVVILLVVLGVGIFIPAAQIGTAAHPMLKVLMLPFLSACREGNFSLGIGLAGLWALIGLSFLYATSRSVNLSRAAQETGHSRQRIQRSQPSSRLPWLTGAFAVFWKNIIIIFRSLTIGQALNWLWMFMSGLAALLAPDWGSRSIFAVFWAIKIHQQTSQPLRYDLRHWPLFQPLPFTSVQLFLTESGPAVLFCTLLGWISLAAASAIGWNPIPWTFFLALPCLIFVLAISAAYDIVRRTQSEHLTAGNIPYPNILALFLSASAIAISMIFLYGIEQGFFSASMVVIVNLIIFRVILQLFKSRYKFISR